MINLSWTQLSMWSFITISIPQALVLIFFPHLIVDNFPDFDNGPLYPFLRLIGLKVIGLMAIYASFTWNYDVKFFWTSIIGRFSIFPTSLYLIYRLGAPSSILLGGVIDWIFGSATGYYLLKEKPTPTRVLFGDNCGLFEYLIRVILFFIGAYELINGTAMFLHPDLMYFMDDPIVAPELKFPPFELGMRELGFITLVMGCYEMYFAIIRASQQSYIAIGIYHSYFYAIGPRLPLIFGYPELMGNISIPWYHSLFGGLILAITYLEVSRLAAASEISEKID